MVFFQTSIEDQLVILYANYLITTGFSQSEASQTAKQLLEEAKKSVIQSGEDKLPKNFADEILTNPKFSKNLEISRKDGVRDEDIRWWFGMQPIERHMMLKVDKLSKMQLVLELLENGKELDGAMKQVAKYHPIFGNPENTEKQSGENRPLPEELKDRIDIYIYIYI